MTLPRREIERLLREHREQLSHELGLAIDALRAELEAELADEIAAITRRIDKVHRNALRALTRQLSGGA